MNILFIEPRYHTNQIQWIKKLYSEGHDVQMFVSNKGVIEDYSIIEPVLYEPCKLSKFINFFFKKKDINNSRNFPNPIKFFSDIRKLKVDIIVVRDITKPMSFLGALVGRILTKKIIIYSQTNIYKKYSLKRRLVISLLLNSLKAKWISPLIGDKNKYSFKPKKMYFVPFAVKIEKNSNNYKNYEPINIITIGKFEKRKNHLLLLEALSKINHNYNLLIIGEVSNDFHQVELAKINNFIFKHNLSAKVTIKTNIPYSNIKKYYHKSNLFILPSTREPASISVIEALGFSLPVICSNTNGTRFYIKENETGLTFIDNSVNDLEKKIKFLLNTDNIQFMTKNINDDMLPIYNSNNFYECFTKLMNN